MELRVKRISGGYYQSSEENSPSPDYPSEIETVSGSVEIDVVNSNLLDFNVTQNNKVTVNEDGTITINGQGGFILAFKRFTAKANTKYYIKWELVSGTVDTSKSNGNSFLNPLDRTYIKQGEFKESVVKNDKDINGIWINNMTVFTNAVIKFWANTDKSDFVEHQSQTAIMPIQQEMLTGDYISDVEHHEWKKLILTGTEALVLVDIYQGIAQFEIGIENSENNAEWRNDDKIRAFSNYYRGVIYNNSWVIDNCITTSGDGRPRIMTSQFTDVKSFTACLKSKYDAGTPVVIYYKLSTPINLELTEEQKAVRENKLYTYKNITNIAVSDELASIDVEYKKDLETMFNNIIKQIPSSTSDTAET